MAGRATGGGATGARTTAAILALGAALALAACTTDGFHRMAPPTMGELPAPEDTSTGPGRGELPGWDVPLPENCPNPPPDGVAKSLRVLFIGNSYTNVNDLPGTFAALAGAGHRKVKVERSLRDGWTLGSPPDDFATDGPTLDLLARGWDVVVLQEQSQMPAYPGMVQTATIPGAEVLARKVRNATPCVRVVLFQTWGRRDGMPPDFADFDAMQDALTQGYAAVADAVGAEVAPVGEAWRIVRRDAPDIALHGGDGSHPAPAGTYLAACTLFGRIFHESPVGLAAPAGTPSPRVLQEASDAAQGP